MEFCRKHKCPFGDCEHHPSHAPNGFAYTAKEMDKDCERLADYRTNEKYLQDRLARMSMGDAYFIFQNINADNITDAEKALAVKKIAEMETHMGVTKAMMLEVIRWLLDQAFEITEED